MDVGEVLQRTCTDGRVELRFWTSAYDRKDTGYETNDWKYFDFGVFS
jgi:hypothetical protein